MAFTTVPSVVTGQTYSAANYNTYLKDNINFLKDSVDTLNSFKNSFLPVGAIYHSYVSTNPATLLGFGTWVAVGVGKVLVGIDPAQTEFDTLGETGGAKTHVLTVPEMPGHTHTVPFDNAANAGGSVGTRTYPGGTTSTSSTGGGGAHNNLQPYEVVYIWRRTA